MECARTWNLTSARQFICQTPIQLLHNAWSPSDRPPFWKQDGRSLPSFKWWVQGGGGGSSSSKSTTHPLHSTPSYIRMSRLINGTTLTTADTIPSIASPEAAAAACLENESNFKFLTEWSMRFKCLTRVGQPQETKKVNQEKNGHSVYSGDKKINTYIQKLHKPSCYEVWTPSPSSLPLSLRRLRLKKRKNKTKMGSWSGGQKQEQK